MQVVVAQASYKINTLQSARLWVAECRVRASLYLGPDWGPARTLKIWANFSAKPSWRNQDELLLGPNQCCTGWDVPYPYYRTFVISIPRCSTFSRNFQKPGLPCMHFTTYPCNTGPNSHMGSDWAHSLDWGHLVRQFLEGELFFSTLSPLL
jgi:hypothetical protein